MIKDDKEEMLVVPADIENAHRNQGSTKSQPSAGLNLDNSIARRK